MKGNDSARNIGFDQVIIRKDVIAPIISIINPTQDYLFGEGPPEYNLELIEGNLDSLWYRLNNGTIITSNTSISFLSGSILQEIWAQVGNGSVSIEFYANDTLGNLGYEVVTIRKLTRMPILIINNPLHDQVFSLLAPNFTISVNGSNLESKWYTLDEGFTNFTFTGLNGYIDQTAWEALPNGIVTIKFYLNDTLGNLGFDEVSVVKDTLVPNMLIVSPSSNTLFADSAPDFIIEINDNYMIGSSWYTIDNGATNFTFSTNGTINQNAWDVMGNGTVLIRFYSNDTAGNLNYLEILVRKDIIAPIITIMEPSINQIFGKFAPSFQITLIDLNLDFLWYSINDGDEKFFLTQYTGTIDQDLWNNLPEGALTLRFGANDTVGNVAYREVIIYKDLPEEPSGFDPMWLFTIIGLIAGILGSTILITVMYNLRTKKSRKGKSAV